MLEEIKKFLKSRKGISPLISYVLIVLITFTVIGIVLLVGVPAIDRAREAASLNEAMQNMRLLDNAVREVASEGLGALRSMIFRISAGDLKVNSKSNSIDFTLNTKTGIISPGTIIEDGNLVLSSGGSAASASQKDFDNDGTVDFVLENEIIRVVVVRNGSSTENVTMNTSGLIKMVNYRDTNVNVTFNDTKIIIDDIPDSSAGTGYTELIANGTALQKAVAIAHVYTDELDYDVVITLQRRADFIELKIQNAYYK